MLNIQNYKKYNEEKRIALLDNSLISFLNQVENCGISGEELLKGYDAIIVPNWVSEEICDSIHRKKYIEDLFAAQFPIYSIKEETYANLVNGEEANLYNIVFAASSKLAEIRSYLQRYVKKDDPLDMEEYYVWIKELYKKWPLSETTTKVGRAKKKNAGEISLTILAEIFSWYYPNTDSITILTQDRDSYEYQKSAHQYLYSVFIGRSPVDVSYKSNDNFLCQMFRSGMLNLNHIDALRNNDRVVIYTIKRSDNSTALVTKKTDINQFKDLIQNPNIQIIF